MSELGRFRVVVRIRLDNPAFPQYLIYLGPNLIGKQFSVPTLSDCEWLERQRQDEIVYARQSAALLKYTTFTRQGRPANGTRRRTVILIETPEEEIT